MASAPKIQIETTSSFLFARFARPCASHACHCVPHSASNALPLWARWLLSAFSFPTPFYSLAAHGAVERGCNSNDDPCHRRRCNRSRSTDPGDCLASSVAAGNVQCPDAGAGGSRNGDRVVGRRIQSVSDCAAEAVRIEPTCLACRAVAPERFALAGESFLPVI